MSLQYQEATKLAAKIKEIELEVISLDEELIDLNHKMGEIECVVTVEVYDDKTYSNETKRKTAIELILSDNPEYTQLKQSHSELKSTLARLNTEKSFCYRMFTATVALMNLQASKNSIS
jgi:hypothetical protein